MRQTAPLGNSPGPPEVAQEYLLKQVRPALSSDVSEKDTVLLPHAVGRDELPTGQPARIPMWTNSSTGRPAHASISETRLLQPLPAERSKAAAGDPSGYGDQRAHLLKHK